MFFFGEHEGCLKIVASNQIWAIDNWKEVKKKLPLDVNAIYLVLKASSLESCKYQIFEHHGAKKGCHELYNLGMTHLIGPRNGF